MAPAATGGRGLARHRCADRRRAYGVAAGRCAGIVLVASSPFLGQLKQHLGEQAHKALLRTVAADYTTLDDRELAQRLAAD